LRAAGYNDAEVTVEVSNREIRENDFKMTPAGKIYFLSKLSGKIDVVKTNLDGSDRQTVLAGTGKEDDRGTVLLAARDWKYLALLSRRETSSPKLYLLDTSNDSMMPMDTANATFTPVGWSGSNFVYTATRDDVQLWQPNHQALKSYNAVTKKTATLDQTKGEGTNNFDYQSEAYGQVYQFDKYIVYSKSWNYGYSADSTTLAHKNSGIYSIWSNGTNPQTLKSFPLSSGGVYIYSVPSHANQAIYQVYAPGSGSPSYFTYQSGRVVQAPSNAADEFNDYQQNPITYLQSPSGDNTFWAESRDGKYALFIGGQNADNAKQIATLSEYLTYGWYTDDYLLVSKNSSELYAMPRDGIKNDTSALKISDYHKPAQNFFGYGGGYGGI
jgi:hypothetical protein